VRSRPSTAAPPRPTKGGYVATLLGALVGDVVLGILGVLPVALLGGRRWSNIGAFLLALLVFVVGLTLGIAAGGGLGAWLALRQKGYRFAAHTGVLIWPIQFVLLFLVVLLPILLLGAPPQLVGLVEAIGLVTAIVVPPMAARAIVLWRQGRGMVVTGLDGDGEAPATNARS
jgi:hypothetical protein